jgi:hypothetical protein
MGRSRRLTLAGLFLFAAACSDEGSVDRKVPALIVTATPSSAAADGVSTINVRVEGSTRGPIVITTNRGFWDNNQKSYSLTGTDAVLHSCDSRTDATCAGVTTIIASDNNLAEGSLNIVFTGFEACNDGIDNNNDTLVDCADPQCPVGTACGSNGKICDNNKECKGCTGNGGPAEIPSETSCTDTRDNDCDGNSDCADSNCSGQTCTTPTGGVGACSGGSCICTATEAAGETTCNDGLDNDCDGNADCADVGSCNGDLCDPQGHVCGGGSCSVCPGGTTEPLALCNDGLDNDCDGDADCDDQDCDGATCGPGSTCDFATGNCVCGGGGGTPEVGGEITCDDTFDNDCDGEADCVDDSCNGRTCGPNSICLNNVCTNQANQYTVALVPERAKLPADGKAKTIINITVTHLTGGPQTGKVVDLTTSLGGLSVAQVTTDGSGKASVELTSAAAAGIATVTGTLAVETTVGTTEVSFPALGEIKMSSRQYDVMGVKFSGYQEQNTLVIELLDTDQEPYPHGLDICFSHQTLGQGVNASTIFSTSPVVDPSCVSSGNTVRVNVHSNVDGLATINLASGTVAGTVQVSAGTSAAGVSRNFDLPSLAIIGAKTSGASLSILCDPPVVPGFVDHNCAVSEVDAQITCVAFLKDRFNNLLGRATTVTFMSEVGAVGQPATTGNYDPTQPPEGQDELGEALNIINVQGARLPRDVPTVGTEFGYSYADGCDIDPLTGNPLPRVHNPRDGVSTIIAIADGEESFFDANGNGVYDLGEPFVDLPEPFIDGNDNDTRDSNEEFVDADGDGSWDSANGVWDANVKLWTSTSVVYSGQPVTLFDAGLNRLSRWMETVDAGTYPAGTPNAAFAVRPGFPADTFTDCNNNQTRDTCANETFTDTNANSVYDPGIDTFVDCNRNGTYDDPGTVGCVAEGFTDLNGNASYDATASAPTTESLTVAIADKHLNRLDETAGYGVEKTVANHKVDVQLTGADSLARSKGLFYANLACDASNLALCANKCQDVAGFPPRCLMRTVIGSYGYGYRGGVTFTGAASAPGDGTTGARFVVDYLDVSYWFNVNGTHQ